MYVLQLTKCKLGLIFSLNIPQQAAQVQHRTAIPSAGVA